jgi:hypothetical protein
MDAHMQKLAPACRNEIQSEETSHARVEAIKAKLRAKAIKEGKTPDPLLDPTPLGYMPGQDVPNKREIAVPKPSTPKPGQDTPQTQTKPPTPSKPAQSAPQNTQPAPH